MHEALHPEFREHAGVLLEIIEYARAHNPQTEELAALIQEDAEWLASWNWAHNRLCSDRVTGLSGSAFAVPFLHPAVCANLVAEAVVLSAAHGHKPNLDEDSPYQIPEIVLKHVAPELHDRLADLIPYLNIWFMLIYQTGPQSISSIQFAKYEPNDTAHGNWHHDKDSDFTAVVSLEPELCKGGGTDIRVNAAEYASINPLPAGYALIMNGKQIMHRGRSVEEGVRHLLVFWLDSALRDDSVSIKQTPTIE